MKRKTGTKRSTPRKPKLRDLGAKRGDGIKGGLAQLRGMAPLNAPMRSSG